MQSLVYATHATKVSRNRRLLEFLGLRYEVKLPYLSGGTVLGPNFESIARTVSIGMTGIISNSPMHLDVIDIFSLPFMRSKQYLVDIRCPVPVELRWLGYPPLALMSEVLMKKCIGDAKVVIAANEHMLKYAKEFTEIEQGFIVPNAPLSDVHSPMNQSRAREELSLNRDIEMALFVTSGRLKSIYGIQLLFQTWNLVRKNMKSAELFIVGPYDELALTHRHCELLEKKGIHFVGKVPSADVSKWISAADVCLAQRTPGFPSQYYNHQDSLKISEYAAHRKPIVAAGYAPSDQYLGADTKPENYATAILKAFNNSMKKPKPYFWEQNYPILEKAYNILISS